MSATAIDRIKAANAQVAGAGAEASSSRTKEVDAALGGEGFLGGHAPYLAKGLGHFIQKAPQLFGRKNVAEVFGIGEVPHDGQKPSWVKDAINLGCKKTTKLLDGELVGHLLQLKKDLHAAELQRQMMVHKSKGMPVSIFDTIIFKEVCLPVLKAFGLTDFAAWVPTLNTGFYFEEFELEPMLDSLLPDFQMSSRIQTAPGALTRLKARLETDIATFTPQYNTSSSYSLTAQDCVAHTDISEDLIQDMVPNAGGFERLMREVAKGVQRSKEDAIINGDDTISSSVQGDGHMDSDVAGGAATLFNKAFKGLRKRALAASLVYDHGGQGVNLALYNGTVPLLGKFAKDKGDLLIIIGPTISNKFVFGGVPEMLTAQNAGLGTATLLTGQLPKIAGIEQYESEWVREDLGAAGVYSAASAFTSIIALKKSRFIVGKRAPIKIWAAPFTPNSDKMLMTAKERFSFGGVPQGGNETSVAIGYDVALT